ncbi:MAG: sigma-54 dependent transcriptional regulator [Planctomycetota bacterium]|jgi:two-component system nitrogen regulation response regulator GlnG|nr:sigma-54 dependent transcriptional regulator [Planctomycetota bacterium]MDP7253624.1 sigma-54 dependent transcriptional regulator [Planctomycetota bacterium]
MPKILIIEDDRNVCWAFEEFLKDIGHESASASSAEEGIELLEKERPDLILLDVKLPGMTGIEALPVIREKCKGPIIVITAHGTMDTAIQAIQRGAFEYLTKPIDLDNAAEVINRALASGPMPSPNAQPPPASLPLEMLGSHPLMQEVFKQIGAVSQSEVTVLISGSSGTGKELAARGIHRHSHRAEKPFIAVDCARLPETLAESELYGHERGAFTGAVEQRLGHFERANGGTVFLDEIGELSPDLQKKLLRFLEEKVVERVGGDEEIKVDVRLIAATHRPLRELVDSGSFRADLFYRLNVVTLHLPDLRDRREDIELLANHFLKEVSPSKAFSEEATAALQDHLWPGNVRELKNAVQHAAVLSRGATIQTSDLPETLSEHEADQGELSLAVRRLVDTHLKGEPTEQLYETLIKSFERPLIQRVLEFTGGNQRRAAGILGMHRTTLRKKVAEYGL